jgi:hypothetical protein
MCSKTNWQLKHLISLKALMSKLRRKWKCERASILITSFVFLWKLCTIPNWVRSGNHFGLLLRRVGVRNVVSDATGAVYKSHSKRCTQLPLACKSLTAVRKTRRSSKISNLEEQHKICDCIRSHQRKGSFTWDPGL